MSLCVHRYPIDISAGKTVVSMPVGAKIVGCGFQSQREEFSVWALVDPAERYEEARTFHFAGTGHPLGMTYGLKGMTPIGSIVMPDGFHVFHVIEESMRV